MTSLIDRYFNTLSERLEKVRTTQAGSIERAAELCAKSIAAEKLVFTFGTGHGALPALESFPRTGTIVGFRVHTNVFGLLASMALVVYFGYALSWIFATLGLAVKDPETAQAAAFPLLAPLVFASVAFVPASSIGRIQSSNGLSFSCRVHQRVCADGKKLLYCLSQKSKSRSEFRRRIGLPRNPSNRPRNS